MVRRSDDQPSLKLRPDKESAGQRRRWTLYEAVKRKGRANADPAFSFLSIAAGRVYFCVVSSQNAIIPRGQTSSCYVHVRRCPAAKMHAHPRSRSSATSNSFLKFDLCRLLGRHMVLYVDVELGWRHGFPLNLPGTQ
jgi:hypothetical protein